MMYFEFPNWTQRLVDVIISPWVYLVVLPLTTIKHACIYLVYGSPFPAWTLAHYVRLNRRRVLWGYYSWLRLPPNDPENDEVPNESKKYLKECQLEQLICPPLEDMGKMPAVLEQGRGNIKRASVPGWWIRASDDTRAADNLSSSARSDERVVYFIIGGGYVGGHPLQIHTPWSIAKITGGRVFCINYRKSLTASTAFPASLLDRMAGLQYLAKEKGFSPKNIMLCGDSAGANAPLAVARCLGEMEVAGCKLLGQPWANMTSSFPSIKRSRYTDHLIDMSIERIPSHTRHFPNKSNPYFSPALALPGQFGHLVRHGVKVYISAGTAEAFHDEIIALYNGMKEDGVDVEVREIIGATHSDFVWHDKTESVTMGWSWSVMKEDFTALWRDTA